MKLGSSNVGEDFSAFLEDASLEHQLHHVLHDQKASEGQDRA
jgi:hypothetical protein